MNDTTTDLDHAEDEILTDTVSDEALESAAGSEKVTPTHLTFQCHLTC